MHEEDDDDRGLLGGPRSTLVIDTWLNMQKKDIPSFKRIPHLHLGVVVNSLSQKYA